MTVRWLLLLLLVRLLEDGVFELRGLKKQASALHRMNGMLNATYSTLHRPVFMEAPESKLTGRQPGKQLSGFLQCWQEG